MKAIQYAKSGFTIVELLIVIVVIGILSTITVVAYNGIVDRANATKALSMARNVSSIVNIFHAANDRWPLAQWSCFGYASDFPAQDNFPAGSCGIRSNDGGVTWSSIYTTNTTLMDELAPYMKPFDPKLSIVSSSGTPVNGTYYYKFRGIVYDDYNMTTLNATAGYPVKGSTCPTPRVPMNYYYFVGGMECSIAVSGKQ